MGIERFYAAIAFDVVALDSESKPDSLYPVVIPWDGYTMPQSTMQSTMQSSNDTMETTSC